MQQIVVWRHLNSFKFFFCFSALPIDAPISKWCLHLYIYIWRVSWQNAIYAIFEKLTKRAKFDFFFFIFVFFKHFITYAVYIFKLSNKAKVASYRNYWNKNLQKWICLILSRNPSYIQDFLSELSSSLTTSKTVKINSKLDVLKYNSALSQSLEASSCLLSTNKFYSSTVDWTFIVLRIRAFRLLVL